jgi:predicted amidophosphoribosyltransferase
MRELDQYKGINCDNCGVHGEGIPDNGRLRCGKCGQYGSEAEEYCDIHDVHYKGLYPEDNHCPMCREERRQREIRQHKMTRDPQLEPW